MLKNKGVTRNCGTLDTVSLSNRWEMLGGETHRRKGRGKLVGYLIILGRSPIPSYVYYRSPCSHGKIKKERQKEREIKKGDISENQNLIYDRYSLPNETKINDKVSSIFFFFVCGVEFGLFHVFDQFVLATFIHGYWIEVEIVLTHFIWGDYFLFGLVFIKIK